VFVGLHRDDGICGANTRKGVNIMRKKGNRFQCARVVVVFAMLFIPSMSWGSGETPETAIDYNVGEGSLEITIEEQGGAVWVRGRFEDPTDVSHLAFETSGDYDTYMHLYKNLEDAQADTPLKEDDDSGEGLNARITQSIGYPSPYFLKLMMYNPEETGTFILNSEIYYEDPEPCPGECAMEAISKDKANARQILAIMRNIKSNLFAKTKRGREIIELYYTISNEIIANGIDLQFSKVIYDRIIDLFPLLQEIFRITIEDGTGMILSEGMVAKINELKNCLADKVSQEISNKIEILLQSLKLNDHVGNSIESVVKQAGFLPSKRSQPAIDKDFFPAFKFEIIIKFRETPQVMPQVLLGRLKTGISSVDQLFSPYQVESVHQIFSKIRHKKTRAGLNRIFKIRMKEVDGIDIDNVIRALLKNKHVEYAEKNKIYRMRSDDVYFGFQYALDNSVYPEADIHAVEAWEIETGDFSVIVSVVDTGIEYYLSDLSGDRLRVDLGYDYVNDDEDPLDDNGHGTHVAGIIGGAYNNYFSIAGVAPNISIVPFKVLDEGGSGYSEDVAAGIVASVDIGAKVINLSLGGDYSQLIEDALEYAYENNTLVVAAAGNDGAGEIGYPASSEFAVSVGATDNQNQRTSFSNYGDGLDLMAPGEDIVSTYIQGLTCYLSGTSMATPYVVGVAGLVISKIEPISVEELKNILFNSAFDLGIEGYDTEFGWGLVNAYDALTFWPGCQEDDTGDLDIVGSVGGTGGMVTIPVRIQNALNEVGSLGFEVTFNPAILTFTGFTKGDLVENFDFFDATNPETGIVRIGGFKATGGISAGASGDVVYLEFDVNPECDGIAQLALQELKDDIASWSTSNGCFDCTVCDCDINEDGEVTPQDALCAFQKYLGICPTNCGPCEEICCDVNGDGDCTPADALEIFKEYLAIVPNACSS